MPFRTPDFFECGSEEKLVQENASIYLEVWSGEMSMVVLDSPAMCVACEC